MGKSEFIDCSNHKTIITLVGQMAINMCSVKP